MEPRKRILGLDVGDKRIGVAVSDELRKIAQPVQTVERTSTPKDFQAIAEIADQYEAASVVVGLPIRLDGTSSPQTEKVREFIKQLKRYITIPVVSWDERLTTTAAEASLIEADVSRKARRKIIDSVAAQLMLQHFLDCSGSP
jgi:putative Holliday junction resolvase